MDIKSSFLWFVRNGCGSERGRVLYRMIVQAMGQSEAETGLQACLCEGLVRLADVDDPLDEDDKMVILTTSPC